MCMRRNVNVVVVTLSIVLSSRIQVKLHDHRDIRYTVLYVTASIKHNSVNTIFFPTGNDKYRI